MAAVSRSRAAKGSEGMFIVVLECLSFEMVGQFACATRAEYAEGTEERMRGAGEIVGSRARDRIADIIDEERRIRVKELNHSLHQFFIPIEAIEELFATEDWRRSSRLLYRSSLRGSRVFPASLIANPPEQGQQVGFWQRLRNVVIHSRSEAPITRTVEFSAWKTRRAPRASASTPAGSVSGC